MSESEKELLNQCIEEGDYPNIEEMILDGKVPKLIDLIAKLYRARRPEMEDLLEVERGCRETMRLGLFVSGQVRHYLGNLDHFRKVGY